MKARIGFKAAAFKTIGLVLTFSMLLYGFAIPVTPYMSSAEAAGNSPVFAEDFESAAPGQYPSSFAPLTQSTNYSAAVAEQTGAGSQVLVMERTAASSSSSYMVKSFDGEEEMPRVKIELKAKASQTNMIQYIPVIMGNNGGVITQLAFFENGFIRAFGPSGWYNLAPYSADQWYQIEFYMDAATQTYDVYIDGENYASQAPFRTEQGGLGLIRLGIQGGGSQDAGSFSVDDIAVYNEWEIPQAEPDTVLFEENFNNLTPDEYPSSFDDETAVSGNRAVVAEPDGDGNRLLEIERFEPNNDQTYFASATFAEPKATALIRFKAKTAQTDVTALIPTIRGTGGPIASIAFHNNGNIAVLQGSWVTFQSGYEVNKWYDFAIAVDASAGKFAIYIDGQMIGDNYSFQTSQADVAKLEFGLFRGNNTAAMYIDDLKVTASIDEPINGVPVSLWNMDQLTGVPEVEGVTTIKDTDHYTVKSLLYKNEPYMGADTQIFAIYGLPKSASSTEKVPAMLLLHGGGGQAYQEWVEQWTAKGYAAIAIDMNGSNSPGVGGPAPSEVNRFTKISSGNLKEMWSYHATTAAIRAVSFLENQPEVDPDKIGAMGISWGGYLTNMVAGLDSRLNLAMPVYGSGFIYEDSAWKSILDTKLTAGQRQLWIDYFDPSSYLNHAQMPMLYANGTNDGFYPVEIWQKSYQLVQGEVSLRLITDSMHGNRENWDAPDFVAFADMHFKDGAARPKVVDQGLVEEQAWVHYSSPEDINTAMLIYTTDTGVGRIWGQAPVSINHAEKRATIHLPANTKAYYFNLIDSIGATVSSEMMTTNTIIVGPQDPDPQPDGSSFAEDFNDLPLDQYPSSFDVEAPAAGNRAVVVGAGDAGNRALEIERYEPNNVKTYFASKTLTEPLETALISFRVKTFQQDVIAHIPTIRGPSGPIAQISFHNNGNISVYQGSWTTIQTGYETDRWYEFQVAVDAAAGQFAIFIDGEMIGDDYQFQTPQTLISKLEFGLFRGNNTAAMYVDDLKVETSFYKPISAVSVSPDELQLSVGSTETLQLTTTPEDALFYEIDWSSGNEQVATVSEGGEVTGVGPGSVQITAQVTDTVSTSVYTASSLVEVYIQPATEIRLDVEQATMPIGSELQVNAEVLPENASDRTVEWSTDNSAVASVDGDGRITAIAQGSATITATAEDGLLSEEVDIEVVARAVQAAFYVAPDGDDLAEGTEAAPFRTLERARDAVRDLTLHDLTGDVEVVLRDGYYELDDTFRLDQRDSGNQLYNVIYKSYPGEEPVVSGGRTITGWTLHDTEKGIYRAPSQGIETRQLYVDGVRATRARSDAGLVDATVTSTGFTSSDTFLAEYDHLDRLEFVFQQIWTQPRAGVESVELLGDGTAVHIEMKQPAWSAVTSKGSTSVNKGPVYYENAYELLDVPGEWFLDGEYFYYIPRFNEQMDQADIIAPVLEELMSIEGQSLDDRVHSIRFEGITFSYNTWMWPSTDWGLSDAQNNILRYPGTDDRLIEAAVTVRRGHHIVFERNTFSKIGSTALKMVEGVQDSPILGNRFFDISGSAVTVGDITTSNPDIYAPSDPRLEMRRVDIDNNYIHDIGVEYASAAAIAAGYPIDSSISHNHIFNIPYSGIHIGYGWYLYTSSGVKNLRVNDNYIHDLLGKGLYDGGAIYTVGYHAHATDLDDYNIATGNYIENQMHRTAVLYADNGSRYWNFHHNVIDFTDTPSWPDYDLYWLRGTEEELLFDHNYITDGKVHDLFGVTIPVFNTHVHPDADWPEEALDIIEQAGLEAEYSDMGIPFERLFWPKTLDLQLQQTHALQVTATRNKGETASLDNAIYYYRSYDEDVATVDSQGVITGVGQGVAAIETQVLWGGIIRTLTTDVYVDDSIQSLEFRNVEGSGRKLILGETLHLDAYGQTELGQQIEFEELTYGSTDNLVVAVSAEGWVTALAEGEAQITVTATAGNFVLTRTLDFEVIQYSSEQGLTYSPFYLNDLLQDTDNWQVSSGQLFFEQDSIRLVTPAGQGYYAGRQFSDELFAFDMSMNASGGYQVIQIRNQNVNANLQNTYAIVFKPNEIELQRFNNGERTVIFGNVGGFTSIGGDAYPNDVFPFNETRQIQVGAVNEENGVRIILNIEGENIFYFLDKEADRIESEGYLSWIARYGDIVVSPAEQRVFAVSYDGNGHTGGMAPEDGQSYGQGTSVTISGNVGELVREGYVFAGWNSEADGTGAGYEPGASLKMGAAPIVLYAEWEEESEMPDNSGGSEGTPEGNQGDNGQEEHPANRLQVAGEDLTATDGEQIVIPLVGDITEVWLPANAAELAVHRTVVIDSDAFKVELPASFLVELYDRLRKAGREGAYISIEMNKSDAGEADFATPWPTELHDGYTKLTPAGTALELRWSIESSEGSATDIGTILHPVYLRIKTEAAGDSDLLGIYRNASGAAIEYAGGDWLDGTIGALIDRPGSYAALIYDRTFGDVPASHWAHDDIKRLAARHIAEGTGAAEFAPNRPVSRAEFATLLARALKLQPGEESLPFADVKGDQWYAEAVASVYEAGLIFGRNDNRFAPEETITREEMAVMLVRAYAWMNGNDVNASDQGGASEFADGSRISDWAAPSVGLAHRLGFVQGTGGGLFAPRQMLTRAQGAKVVMKLLDAAGER